MNGFSSKTTFILFTVDKIAFDWVTFEKFRYCKIYFKGYQSKECNGGTRNKVN